jgi:hypothetical protein
MDPSDGIGIGSRQGRREFSWQAFLKTVRGLPNKALWRHDVSGDLPGTGEKINRRMLAELVSGKQR